MTRLDYGGYIVEVEAAASGDLWAVKGRIYREMGGQPVKSLDGLEPLRFSSAAEAERVAAYLARAWIDEHGDSPQST